MYVTSVGSAVTIHSRASATTARELCLAQSTVMVIVLAVRDSAGQTVMEELIVQRANAPLVSNLELIQQLESNLVSPVSLDMANCVAVTMLVSLAAQEACRPATAFASHVCLVASNLFLSARLVMHAPAAPMLWQEQEPALKRLSAV